jgi:cytoskeletal protein RodZ
MDDNDITNGLQTSDGIGAQLRAARQARGLSLEQVAAETRIPQRHLVAIEAGDFSKLPGRTYAVGFTRTYAKMLGLAPDDSAAMVRAELDAQSDDGYRQTSFEPGDPARVPSRALGWFAALAVVLLIAGVFFFFRTMFAPAGELPSLLEQQKKEQAAAHQVVTRPSTAPAAPSGPITLTAQAQGIWIKVYDGQGKTLFEKLMNQGESFTVPADAQGPMLWTGRPDALAITVGGKAIPRLADHQTVLKDVPLSPESLAARANAAAPAPAVKQPSTPVSAKPPASALQQPAPRPTAAQSATTPAAPPVAPSAVPAASPTA